MTFVNAHNNASHVNNAPTMPDGSQAGVSGNPKREPLSDGLRKAATCRVKSQRTMKNEYQPFLLTQQDKSNE